MAGATAGAMAVKGLWPKEYGEGLSYAVNAPDPGLTTVQVCILSSAFACIVILRCGYWGFWHPFPNLVFCSARAKHAAQ